MSKDFEKIVAEKDTYDAESRTFIESLQFIDKEISQLNTMKSTEGWKLLEKKLREELQLRIHELVKNDSKIQVLLSLLTVADTKSQSNALQEEIAKLLPHE
jgi:hypothetical protein